ncbi:TPM domain-containing protein [Ectobacillus panaciterrae]|uniref:TPM domain-containing protein n=1 Tax=Ectobacillus panaciterrae TaxID=363872 RepID=UPI00041D588A|nr:TPM domain-containing protein [Ectobacillus panaciterrae]
MMQQKTLRFLSLLLLISLSLMCFIQFAYAFDKTSIPKPVGDIYVQDPDHFLSAETKQQIISEAKQLHEKNGAQVAMLFVKSLKGNDIREYSLEAFRSYGLGSKEKNNGVLFVVAVNDRKARIEVGYGLEGAIPDAKAGNILETYAFPALKTQNYDRAALDTFRSLASIVRAEGGSAPPKQQSSSLSEAFILLLFILGGMTILILILMQIQKKRRPKDPRNPHYDNYNPFPPSDGIPPVIWYGDSDNHRRFDDSGGGFDSGGGGSSGGGGADGDW